MISTSRRRTLSFCCLIAVVLLAFNFSSTAKAQGSLTLSISPSLFDMSANPGQEWRSSLKVINVNDFDLTVYLDVVNFLPQGETGDVQFVPVNSSETSGTTVAEWFTIQKEPIVIPQEQSLEIPFSVRVPTDASPGGHFAAVLVGTKPITPEEGQARVQTSQMVTALFFARVAGDVQELGLIREFRTTDTYLNNPEATFELRFENKGNVHLQPQGDIRITNMWGQERGVIPINQNTSFGKVMPESTRKFTFTWKGDWSISDIGRYTAEVTLAYGSDSRQFSSSKTNFWVIPYKLLLGIAISLVLFFALVTWFVRLYVRHMLTMAGVDINEYQQTKNKKSAALNVRFKGHQRVKIHTPLQIGILDLKQKLQTSANFTARLQVIVSFCCQYRLFFAALALVLIFVAVLTWYLLNANAKYRGYEIVYVNSDANVTLSSEDIEYNKLRALRAVEAKEPNPNLPKIKIINRSGTPGVGAEARLLLEAQGYEVISLTADFSSPQTRTVIIYNPENEAPALTLSRRLNNAPISVYEDTKEGEVITVYVGSDIQAD